MEVPRYLPLKRIISCSGMVNSLFEPASNSLSSARKCTATQGSACLCSNGHWLNQVCEKAFASKQKVVSQVILYNSTTHVPWQQVSSHHSAPQDKSLPSRAESAALSWEHSSVQTRASKSPSHARSRCSSSSTWHNSEASKGGWPRRRRSEQRRKSSPWEGSKTLHLRNLGSWAARPPLRTSARRALTPRAP